MIDAARTFSTFTDTIENLRQASVGMGAVIVVDSIFGNDEDAQRGSFSLSYQTIEAAIAAATSGDVILILPGSYSLESGITIPNGVAIRGISLARVTIQMLGVTANTTLVTMGESTRLEDVTLKLTSAGHYTLTGVKFGGTTSATAKLRSAVVSVDNSGAGAGTSNVYGVLVQSTGTPNRETMAIRACTVTVNSVSSGVKRGILMDTSAGYFWARDSNFVARGGTNAIGAESNIASCVLGMLTGVCDGDTADISQTLGSLEVGNVDLVHSNANAKGFTATNVSFSMVWADPGSLPPSSTRYYRPGSAGVTTTEIKLNVPRKAVIKKIHVRSLNAPGTGKTDTWIVRKNGADTSLTASLSDLNLVASNDDVSVSFAANDDISLKVVAAPASRTSDTVITVDFY